MNDFLKTKCLNEKINFKQLFQKLIINIYSCMAVAIIVICICFSEIKYANKGLCLNFLPPIILIFFGFAFSFGIYHMINCFNLERRKKYILMVSIFLFFLQLFFVYNYYFYTDWDAEELIKFSDLYIHHQNTDDYKWYFSRYPNNLFLVGIFSAIRFLGHSIGLHAHEYFMILSIQCLLNTITGYLLFCILEYLFKNTNISFLGYIIYIFLIGLSPWVSIPYSDSMALIFPTLIIYIYICKNKINCTIMWFMIGLCSIVGYKIKPQTFIVFIAIILVEIFNTKKSYGLKKQLVNIFIAALGVLFGLCIIKFVISLMHIPLDENMSFGIAHFFMMGMNPVDMGNWSGNDVEFSASFATCAERNSANLYEALKRIKDMQLLGIIKQLVRKTLTNYYNGTFSWAAEGIFFREIFNPKNTPICDFLRGLYYTGEYAYIGKYYIVWSNFEQMVWLTIIFLNIFSYHAPKNNQVCVIMLSILGLTVFELLFEARARYLFTYVPLYIILALYGFQYIISRLERLKQSSEKSSC